MQIFYLLLAALLFSFAWLSPYHTYPWVTFSSELASFAGLFALFAACLNQKLRIAKPQLWLLPLTFIPIFQWSFGLIADLSVALLSTFYLLGFWLMIVLGYQLSLGEEHRVRMMHGISWLLMVMASVSALMAVIQWLNLETSLYGIMQLKSNRPYANFGQPNNLSTFLIMGLMGALYLYESRKTNLWLLFPLSILILFAIGLAQSRTASIVCLFILFYWVYKTYKQQVRLTWPKLLLWAVVYFLIAEYLLPSLTQFMTTTAGTEVTSTLSIVERASGGHERIGMWIQILHAIAERPWLGYGWNQTSIAVFESIHFNTVQVWFNSAHNVLLDILVWNGIPLGIVIIGYMALWLFWLNKNARDRISVVAILMVSAILIHAMLEFPQRYACFLLPMGFLLGLIQAQTPELKGMQLSKHILCSVWVVGIIVLLLIWRDYKLFQDNSRLVFKNQPAMEEILGSSKILLLTQFQQRLDWIRLDATTTMTDQQLAEIGEMVKNKTTPYNLKKYAQVLVYNHKLVEAEQQLQVLEQLYKQKVSLAEVVELNQEQDE